MANETEFKRDYASVLSEAADIVKGDRQEDYGDISTSFNQIAGYWSVYLTRLLRTGSVWDDQPANGLRITLTGTDVANLMMLLKISRAQNKSDRDSYVDIAGYVACVDMLEGLS